MTSGVDWITDYRLVGITESRVGKLGEFDTGFDRKKMLLSGQ